MPEATGRLVAVANLKGGSGKSTLAVHLAGVLGERGWRAILLDADPQHTAYLWAKRVRLPADAERQPLGSIVDARRWVVQLLGLLSEYDFVVLDLPSVIGPAVASALLLGHVVLVPVPPAAVDVEGTQRTLRYVRSAREARTGAPPMVRLVPVRIANGHDLSALCARLAVFGEPLALPLGEYPELAACFADGVWIGSDSRFALARQAFDRLAQLVEGLATGAGEPPLVARARRLEVPPAAKTVRPLRHLAPGAAATPRRGFAWLATLWRRLPKGTGRPSAPVRG
ncbi:hypothetical protein HRbin40_01407 [bacterium HR40]|nr:hypothetical protein HRbin40_01407 [bacterium HR40]